MGPKSRWGGGVGSSGDRLCQTGPIPRSPDGEKKIKRVNPTPRMVDHQRTSHSQKKPKQIRGHVYRLKTINSAVSGWCKKEEQIFLQNQYKIIVTHLNKKEYS